MKKKFSEWNTTAGVVVGASLLLVLAACATTSTGTAGTPATPQKEKSNGANGAKLWAMNCGHCHNIRSPGSYSDAQWDVAMLHMRVRANLTAEEHREILAFLKSAR